MSEGTASKKREEEEDSEEEEDDEYVPSDGDDSEADDGEPEAEKRALESVDPEEEARKKARVDDLYEKFKKTSESPSAPPPSAPAAPKTETKSTVIFAGEKISVTRPAAGSSAPAGKPKPQGGFGALLSQIGKKEKLSVLGKSKLDWDAHVSTTSEKEDLARHNKDGYLERTAFLQRTEAREYENELERRQGRTTR